MPFIYIYISTQAYHDIERKGMRQIRMRIQQNDKHKTKGKKQQ